MIRRPPRSTLFPYPTLFRSRAAIERAVDVLVALHPAGSVHGKGVEVQERVLSGERLTFPFARGAEFRDGLATSCDRDPLPLFGAGHELREARLGVVNVDGLLSHRKQA